ncbi:hypothetical protein MMC29_003315 [Sticta canariensis]|nr:hypothetical protein [Sticta canariensis]
MKSERQMKKLEGMDHRPKKYKPREKEANHRHAEYEAREKKAKEVNEVAELEDVADREEELIHLKRRSGLQNSTGQEGLEEKVFALPVVILAWKPG